MKVKKLFRNNGLSIVVSLLFIVTLFGQAVSGWRAENQENIIHGKEPEGFSGYLASYSFHEATFENWESEFFQMGLYVILTAYLYQKGSSESKDPEANENCDRNANPGRFGAPSPLKSAGLVRWLYEHSLSLAFLLLFLFCFTDHCISGAKAFNEEKLVHGQQTISTLDYLFTSRFWFESLQNWQSEFLSVLSIVVLSIWLREKGSPESKPVDAAHSSTGE